MPLEQHFKPNVIQEISMCTDLITLTKQTTAELKLAVIKIRSHPQHLTPWLK
jgi:hypothetical protein